MTDLEENGQLLQAEREETEDDIISEEELNKRRKYLEDLKTFLTEQQEKISLTLEQLGWTPEHFIKPQNKVTCPYNPSHILPESSLDKHLETCQWLSKGVPRYQLRDVLGEKERLKNTPISTIQLDECKLNGILWNKAVKSGQVYTGQRKLPVTPEDDSIILTPDERLAVHEYVVSEAQSQGIMMNVEKDEHLTIDWQKVIKKGVLESETSDKLTPLEKMQALRDFKRRRQKYRAKNVHITRKSYTEIIREVISNQVEMWGAEESGGENVDDVEVVEGMDSGYLNRESRGSQDSSGYGRDSGRGWSDRERNDRGRDREPDRRRSYKDDRDRGSYWGQTRESSYRDSNRDQSRESYGDSSRGQSRESSRGQYRESSHREQSRETNRDSKRVPDRERENERRDYERERSRKREREGSRERSRSSDRRPPKREKYEMSQMKSERETTPMVDHEREDSTSKTSHKDRYQEESSSRSHKKSKKHKHKKKHKKHKSRKKSSSSSDSESPS
ncbi:hypothetical protein LOTGIDRAFT_166309 [Lottia gigantea]|uniref:CHHC U11-48K-type domain-containing protein n=1 Tax=Lottia gigantea TaxID=225164 RepID=V3ZTL3_LOTGI|nr:hypothetical protein LOTGIDRAFT_166309 [Lottia gigantea]ESO87722.1 hypothetical protein LOTGIDRAFT_166309 [Lottia gigantea]